jgi:anti-sigma B factor antagonist
MRISIEPLTPPADVAVTIESENLDAGNAQKFKDAVQPYLQANMTVVMDMQHLKFVDSSGLGAMLSCLRTMNNKQGQLKLVGLTKPVRALFELVRMHRIFAIYNTREEAIASL